MYESVKYVIAVLVLALAATFAAGCESADDNANCVKFEDSSWMPAPKGCVPRDFDPDKVDFTAPCQNDGLAICTSSSCYDCYGYVCRKGKWEGSQFVIDAGCGYAYCHYKTTAASSNPGDYDCPSYSLKDSALLEIFAL